MSDTKLLQDLERSKKLKLETAAEAKAMLSFEVKIPRLLHNESLTATRKGKSYLKKLATYEDWWDNGNGLKERLAEELPSVEQGFMSQIDDRLTPGTLAHSVAMQAVTQSIAWIGELSRYIDETYDSLVWSGFSKASAWSLTTKLVHRIFSDIQAIRTGTLQSFKPDDIASTCYQVLWGVFKTHDVMASYKRHKFKNHPSISSEYVKFLASNSSNDMIDKLLVRVGNLDSLVKTLTTDLGKTNGTASLAQNRAAEGKKELADLERRVKKLEGK